MFAAVAVSTVAVVLRQLIRGNAIAHVVFVPWCDNKPRKEMSGRCVLTDVKKARLGRAAPATGHQNDELLRHAHVAHRKPEAVPEEREEQGADLLQVVSEP